jgi:gas vesicle protein
MNKFGSFMFGAFSGALVGSVLALLLTPLKGTALRERIGTSFTDVQSQVKNAAQTRVGELNQQLAMLQNKITE